MLRFFSPKIFKLHKLKLKQEYLSQLYSFSSKKTMAEEKTIFDKIVSGDIKCDKVYEDEKVRFFALY